MALCRRANWRRSCDGPNCFRDLLEIRFRLIRLQCQSIEVLQYLSRSRRWCRLRNGTSCARCEWPSPCWPSEARASSSRAGRHRSPFADDSVYLVDCDSNNCCWVSSAVDWTWTWHSVAAGNFSAWAEGRACKVRTLVEVMAFCDRRDYRECRQKLIIKTQKKIIKTKSN